MGLGVGAGGGVGCFADPGVQRPPEVRGQSGLSEGKLREWS